MITVYVDQSGKIEDTSKITVIAYAGKDVCSIQIGAVEKRKLIIAMRAMDFPKKIYIFKIFSGMVYLLINGKKIDKLIIDREYPGNEATIKNIVLGLLGKTKIDIGFSEIGKENTAHKIALGTYQRNIRPTMKTDAQNILKLFYNKKSWRSQSSRDNL